MQIPTSKYFKGTYPNICRFVETQGWIEIGQNLLEGYNYEIEFEVTPDEDLS